MVSCDTEYYYNICIRRDRSDAHSVYFQRHFTFVNLSRKILKYILIFHILYYYKALRPYTKIRYYNT